MGRTVVIGLTGPIGCGKTTVARWLAAAGAEVVDADAVARLVVEPGEPALEAVFERFGDDVRRPDGSLDRAALGRIVFADPAALGDLEAIVHPAVRPRILGAIEAIKLVEGGLAAMSDEVWLVSCDPEAQRGRLAGRGLDREDADRRIDAQGDVRERLAAVATRVVDTSGPRSEARARALAAYEAALAAA